MPDIPYVPGKEPAVEIRTPTLQIAPEGKLMVRLFADGTIEYGPDYKPNEAAIAFWNAMSYYFPAERRVSDLSHDDIFWHKCAKQGCDRQVEFDDEPYCFTHSPDEGPSHLDGYSARRAANLSSETTVKHNVFDEKGKT